MSYFKQGALIELTETVVTSGTAYTLTTASKTNIQFTGSTAQNVNLPNATLLPVGRKFTILNRSTATITVKYFGGSTLTSVSAGAQVTLLVISNATSDGTWDVSTNAGGGAGSVTTVPISNNQSTPADLSGFLINPATCHKFVAEIGVERGSPAITDGTINTTYNSNTPTFSGSVIVYSAATQSTGLAIMGNSNNGNQLKRLLSTGAEDTTFSTNAGAVFGTGGYASGIAMQSDDAFVVSGQIPRYKGITRHNLIRVLSDGNEDTTFASNLGTGLNAPSLCVVLDSSGNIYVGGSFTSFNGNTRNRIIKLLPSGVEDSTFFGNVGTAANGDVSALAITPSGKLLVGGAFTTFNGSTVNGLTQLNLNGTFDTSFTGSTGVDTQVLALDTLSNGTILVGGNYTTINGASHNGLAALTTTGAIDSTYTSNIGGLSSGAIVNAITVQSDNKAIFGGVFTTVNSVARVNLARLLSTGVPDTTFDTNIGTGPSLDVYAIAVNSNDVAFVGGSFVSFNGVAVRYFVSIGLPPDNVVDQFTLRGKYSLTAADWTIGGMVGIGDGAGVVLSITPTGQIQYTSTNLPTMTAINEVSYSLTEL